MSGIDLRMAALFGGKANLVISALDHVVEYGDQPGIEQAAPAIRNCQDTDALLRPRFMLQRNWELLAGPRRPVPVFTIGAEKLNTDLEVLRKAHASVKQGARGIIFGRNIFMARNPPALILALNAVIWRCLLKVIGQMAG